MKKSYPIICLFMVACLGACSEGTSEKDDCRKQFLAARKIAFDTNATMSMRDSAITLLDKSLQCDEAKKAAVDIKITLLVSRKRFAEGMRFIDSLNENDFTFPYKKQFLLKALEALSFEDRGDTANRNRVCAAISAALEQYIEKHQLEPKEFMEIYVDMFLVKGKYLTDSELNREVELLKSKYPGKESFFNSLKQDANEAKSQS